MLYTHLTEIWIRSQDKHGHKHAHYDIGTNIESFFRLQV
jgi:hypothetical protein